MEFIYLSSFDQPTFLAKNEIAEFLHSHLDEFGDNIIDIHKCLDYALSKYPHQGGFVLLSRENGLLTGAVVMCQTGMDGYVPENLLVYIAVHRDFRGRGLGKQLVERAISTAKGNIALHVEPDNPARKLYEKLGFTHKYLEMRLYKKK